jgi:hypothetical protein
MLQFKWVFVQDGFGNIRAGCRQCGCDPTGSRSDACDADSGQCDCHPGIQGLTCNECQPQFYGYSNKGCKSKEFQFVGTNDICIQNKIFALIKEYSRIYKDK